ncbi:MAG TPA: hypothetical protein VLV48_05115, partial [Thermoanaerobaculia bacterium]|nr:hypothetical protein [Thermoanaerobaculia bacterium]
EPPGATEAAIVALLVLLLAAAGTVVFSAAILSFSVREARQIPAVARSSRSRPILIGGAAMILLTLGATRIGTPEPRRERPQQIVIVPGETRVALLAVDGLTDDLYGARLGTIPFPFAKQIRFPPAASATERWATIGTGTPPELHQVRSVESLRLPAGDRVLQQVSRFDPLASDPARRIGLVRRQPLPSAIRERDYVWEILAARGVPAVAVNWWVTARSDAGALRAVPQEEIFRGSPAKDPALRALSIDDRALDALEREVRAGRARFATAYLPALDILMNRLDIPQERRVALSVRALDRIAAAVAELRRLGFDVILVGSPAAAGEGAGVLAMQRPILAVDASPADIAPTLLDLFGFPASREMPGSSLVPRSTQSRIESFGSRTAAVDADPGDRSEYHDALRSLGYVR